MKLISSSETIAFLSRLAPVPWITRMHYGMIVNGELAAYFTKATVRAHTYAFYFMHEVAEKGGGETGAKMDAAIRDA